MPKRHLRVRECHWCELTAALAPPCMPATQGGRSASTRQQHEDQTVTCEDQPWLMGETHEHTVSAPQYAQKRVWARLANDNLTHNVSSPLAATFRKARYASLFPGSRHKSYVGRAGIMQDIFHLATTVGCLVKIAFYRMVMIGANSWLCVAIGKPPTPVADSRANNMKVPFPVWIVKQAQFVPCRLVVGAYQFFWSRRVRGNLSRYGGEAHRCVICSARRHRNGTRICNATKAG